MKLAALAAQDARNGVTPRNVAHRPSIHKFLPSD